MEQGQEAVKTVEVKQDAATVTTPVEGVVETVVEKPIEVAIKEVVEKTLDGINIADVKKKVSDIEVFGNGDLWQLISKASSKKQGWMKSTKALLVNNGVVLQVTTQQRNPDDSYAIAEALVFVPNVHIFTDGDGNKGLT